MPRPGAADAALGPYRRTQQITAAQDAHGLTFNFAAALPGRASSPHTERAYYRWIDTYLVDVAGLKPTTGDDRLARMQALPLDTLLTSLSAPQLRAWLGQLVRRGQGKQALEQARASIVTLTDLLAEAGWVDEILPAAMSRVRPPKAEAGQRPGRWLSLEQVRMLMRAAPSAATSDQQALRNQVAITMLCTMALRRDELASATWGDLSIQNNRAVLRVHGKGRKVAMIDVPRPVMRALDDWRRAITAQHGAPRTESRIVRQVWRGGKIGGRGMTPEGIWLIVERSAKQARIGHVAPHDLRRSVAGALHEAGTPIDTISRLLRHSNVAVTERYLNRLPQRNEGAVLMSSALGLEDDDWPGFE